MACCAQDAAVALHRRFKDMEKELDKEMEKQMEQQNLDELEVDDS